MGNFAEKKDMMKEDINSNEFLSVGFDNLLPGASIDCVILGFHEGEVKILLNRFKRHDHWMLPGGFVQLDKSLDDAANWILYNRTKLKDCYLRQFHTFGDPKRANIDENKKILIENGIDPNKPHWLLQRFISIGYYALIDYRRAKIKTNKTEEYQWFSLENIPELYSDHNHIVKKAMQELRLHIYTIPIGIDLLPEKFTLSELRTIYETVLAKKIDRRNFQRKMLSDGLIYKLDEVSKKFGVKETTLFSFNKEKYKDALENGMMFL